MGSDYVKTEIFPWKVLNFMSKRQCVPCRGNGYLFQTPDSLDYTNPRDIKMGYNSMVCWRCHGQGTMGVETPKDLSSGNDKTNMPNQGSFDGYTRRQLLGPEAGYRPFTDGMGNP